MRSVSLEGLGGQSAEEMRQRQQARVRRGERMASEMSYSAFESGDTLSSPEKNVKAVVYRAVSDLIRGTCFAGKGFFSC